MKIGILLPVLAFLILLTAGYKGRLYAQESADIPGPAVGDKIPEFSLVDQNGKVRDFESMAGPNGLVMLFHRSANW